MFRFQGLEFRVCERLFHGSVFFMAVWVYFVVSVSLHLWRMWVCLGFGVWGAFARNLRSRSMNSLHQKPENLFGLTQIFQDSVIKDEAVNSGKHIIP